MQTPQIDETPSEEAPTPSEEGSDLSQGYHIVVTVRPDGYSVSDPEPLATTSDESQDPAPSGEVVPDQLTMVKHLLQVIKSNPIGGNPQEEFQAGFESGPGATPGGADRA